MAKIVGNTVGVPNPVSDWHQNDIAKAGYVKNRTHYAETKSIVDNAYVDFDGAYIIEFTSDFELNKTYQYNVDGTVGTVKFTTVDETVDICGVPCWLSRNPTYYLTTWFNADAIVDFYEENIIPLDEKYIPDTIARKSDIGDINVALDEIIALQEEFMIPSGDEVSY